MRENIVDGGGFEAVVEERDVPWTRGQKTFSISGRGARVRVRRSPRGAFFNPADSALSPLANDLTSERMTES
eukprot:9483373-Pyramimonas_sp.AAC.1